MYWNPYRCNILRNAYITHSGEIQILISEYECKLFIVDNNFSFV
jgi:hypothetical protein